MRQLTEAKNSSMYDSWVACRGIIWDGSHELDIFEAGFIAGLDHDQAKIEVLEAIIQSLKDWQTAKRESDKSSSDAYFKAHGNTQLQAQKLRAKTKELYQTMLTLLEKYHA